MRFNLLDSIREYDIGCNLVLLFRLRLDLTWLQLFVRFVGIDKSPRPGDINPLEFVKCDLSHNLPGRSDTDGAAKDI
jgi:hypothetical protein